MNAEAWSRLQEALADALEAPPGARAALLAERLGDDAQLLAEARELLAEESGAQRLDPRGASALAPLLDVQGDSDPWIGRRLERWRVVAPLGAGGMGSVYVAERWEAPFEQQVALKLLHASLVGESGRARFRTEQRVLARLEHAGIVRLIDGGVTPEGVPFLVMERVEGAPIDRWCDERKLGLRARVRLFGQVCDAVHFAHRNLVVHRDLKPSNVLVNGDGRARLLDFGIARLLDPESEGHETRTELRAMTPRYASPEQVRGEPVSTASDVYSLGILLYELLTGRSAYDVPTGAPSQVESAICDSRPGRPSTRVTGGTVDLATELAARRRADPARLRRALAGDLDAIVLRAIAKEPQRRYSTAGELRDDLERWLDGQPVRARPDSLGYRLQTFVRRNRVAVGAALAVLAALVIGLVATLQQYRAARAAESDQRAARELAERRLDDLRELATSLVLDVHDQIRPSAGTLVAREAVLEAATHYLERLSVELPEDPGLGLELSRAWVRLGDAQGEPARANLGRPGQARESYGRALAAAAGSDGGLEAEYCAILARARLGELDVRAGDVLAAERQLREALELRSDLARRDPQGFLRFPDEGALRVRLADVLQEAGQLDQAERELQLAVDSFSEHAGAGYETGALRYHAALASWRLGRIADRRADWAAAESAYAASLENVDALLASGSTDQDHRRHAMLSCLDLARARARNGQGAQAMELALRGLAEARTLGAADPLSARARDDQALAHNLLAEFAVASGSPSDALEHYQAGLELRRAVLADQPDGVEARRNVAKNVDFVATVLGRLGREDEAVLLHGEALETFEQLARDDPGNAEAQRSVAVSAGWLGEALAASAANDARGRAQRRDDLEAAVVAFERALEVLDGLRAGGRLAPSDSGVGAQIEARVDSCVTALAALQDPPPP